MPLQAAKSGQFSGIISGRLALGCPLLAACSCLGAAVGAANLLASPIAP